MPVPPARQACLLLIDGLGWDLLRENPDRAPFLTSRLVTGGDSSAAGAAGAAGLATAPLSVGYASTTATSLASLGTGLPPGEHGVIGYEVAVPGEQRILNSLLWDDLTDPVEWQPHATWFEHAAAAGITATRVGPRGLDGSGLSRAALRGGRYAPADTLEDRIAATVHAVRAGGPALVYCYYGELDTAGHAHGCTSAEWRDRLVEADGLAERLANALPPGAGLWVTADHGMVDVPEDARVDAAADPMLRAEVAQLAGEPRARHVYTEPGAAEGVLARWRERLGAGTTVLAREEAIAAGWFGATVSPRVHARIGDVVTAARAPAAVVDSARMSPRALAVVGMHGSLTAAELLVPFLQAA